MVMTGMLTNGTLTNRTPTTGVQTTGTATTDMVATECNIRRKIFPIRWWRLFKQLTVVVKMDSEVVDSSLSAMRVDLDPETKMADRLDQPRNVFIHSFLRQTMKIIS